jgi:hypothetical protein
MTIIAVSPSSAGWEEKKSKTSWGAETVDYEKIATAGVQAMKTADLYRFLVVAALVSDLYCPGYNPKQSLTKDCNLARTAVRYKIDLAKVGAAVRAGVSQNQKQSERRKPIGQEANHADIVKS